MLDENDFLLATTLDEIDLSLFHEIYGKNSLNVEFQIKSYLRNTGFRRYHILKMLQKNLCNNVRTKFSSLQNDEIIDRWGRLTPATIGIVGKSQSDYYPEPREASEKTVLLEKSENEWFDQEFPRNLSFAHSQKYRSALTLYSETNPIVHIESCGYQVFTGDQKYFLASASPFSYTNRILGNKEDASGDFILISDIFNGSNFCHFLLDWLNRVNVVYAFMPELCRKARFLIGGVPGKLHRKLIEAVASTTGLPTERFIFFPEKKTLSITGSVYWLSDSFEHNSHPGNLMHSQTVSFLNDIGRKLTAENSRHGEAEKIYISRNDAKSRKVSNEEKLYKNLEQYGFKIVELSKLSADDQIRLMSSAKTIVAPHGMGLTYVAINQNKPKVVELFHPSIGTDAYSVMTKAKGGQYDYIVGSSTSGSDFSISVDELLQKIN